MTVRPLHLFLTFAAVLLVSGCQRRPLDFKIQARNDLAFSLWISAHVGGLTPDDKRDLEDAVKQIKFATMIASPGLSPKEFSDQVYADVNGATVRRVLLRSLEIQAERITTEIKALEARDDRYREMERASLSNAKRQFIEDFNARMAERRAALQRLEDRKTLLLAR